MRKRNTQRGKRTIFPACHYLEARKFQKTHTQKITALEARKRCIGCFTPGKKLSTNCNRHRERERERTIRLL